MMEKGLGIIHIDGAINNIITEALEKTLELKDIFPYLRDWIIFVLYI